MLQPHTRFIVVEEAVRQRTLEAGTDGGPIAVSFGSVWHNHNIGGMSAFGTGYRSRTDARRAH